MQAQTVGAVRGFSWLREGFALYRRNPPILTMLTLGFLMFVAALGLAPIGEYLLPLVVPALTALVANGCRAIDHAKVPALTLARGALTAGLAEHRAHLLQLGVLHLAAMLFVMGLNRLLGGAVEEPLGPDPHIDARELWRMLRLLALTLPVLLAFWFAPLLTAWAGIPAGKSLFFSFVAAWRNWRAFLAYGCGVMLFGGVLPTMVVIGASMISPQFATLVSLALQGVLLLVFFPVVMATVYLSYRDVFAAAPQDA